MENINNNNNKNRSLLFDPNKLFNNNCDSNRNMMNQQITNQATTNVRVSPTPSQSWIEENLHSIIQNDDTFNDSIKELDSSINNNNNNQATSNNTNYIDDDIEKPRAFTDTPSDTLLFKPNPLKRSASPDRYDAFKSIMHSYNFNEWDKGNYGTTLQLSQLQVENSPVTYIPSPPFSGDNKSLKTSHNYQPHFTYSTTTTTNQNMFSSSIQNEQSYNGGVVDQMDQFQSFVPMLQPSNFSSVLKSIENQFSNNNSNLNSFNTNQYYPQQQQQQQQQQDQHSNGNNKIFKSTSTLFKDTQKFNQNFVSHSISSDNVSTLNFDYQTKVDQTRPIKSGNNHTIYQQQQMFNQQQQQQQDFSFNDRNKRQQGYFESRFSDTENQAPCSGQQKEPMVLHVRNLDYKISADEWRRILTENFKKHCKDVISVNIVTNTDKSLLGIVKLGNKDDVRLAISSLHHKKIGYKRLNVAVAFTPLSNSPRSKVVTLLRSSETHGMALTRFMEMYETRYNQSITIAELFKLRDVIHIMHSKDGQGRLIKLLTKGQAHNLYNEMKDLMHTPYCLLHSHKFSVANKNALSSPGACWLPNVIVSLRLFKPLVHKLLNDHGGQMPLLSFLDCYRACILNEPVGSQNVKNTNSSQSNYHLIIDNENGVPLEHLATCAQDVIISFNEGVYKQLQWENDKSKHTTLPQRQSFNGNHKTYLDRTSSADCDYGMSEFDESLEESQRKQNQFSHEVVELFKSIPRCIIPLSKFSTEYHKKYGRQCRVADYGFTKLYDLIESIPHVLQVLGSEYDKKLTLTHRVQVRRFSNDLIKVLKAHSSKQMFADEYPVAYEKHFGKQFDIKDYGVCFLEDMLAELPESTISRKEIDNRTFIQIPKVVQMEEEKLCTQRLTVDIIDMLRHKPRFSIQFNKFIPNFHHHFGRQLKLSNFGFTKLIELLEAIPETVQVFTKDGLQFVQLKQELMFDLICKNILNLAELNGSEMQCNSLVDFETMYNSNYDAICYEDFGCSDIVELFKILPFKKHFITVNIDDKGVSIAVETINEREVKRIAKLILKKLMDEKDESIASCIYQKKSVNNSVFTYSEMLNSVNLSKNDIVSIGGFNKRTKYYLMKCLAEYFKIDEKLNDDFNEESISLAGFSDLYVFAKQLRSLFARTSCLDMSIVDLEVLYKQTFKSTTQQQQINLSESQKFATSTFTPKKLGFIDMALLFTQGLNLIFTIKKHSDKRAYLNKEFWPQALIDANVTFNTSFNSPQSPIHNVNDVVGRSPYTPVSYHQHYNQ